MNLTLRIKKNLVSAGCNPTPKRRSYPLVVLWLSFMALTGGYVSGTPRLLAAEPTSRASAASRITQDLTYLASDELAGRGVGSDGLVRAGEFIASRFSELGLNTQAFNTTPFQQFEIPGPVVIDSTTPNELTLNIKGTSAGDLRVGVDYTPLSLGRSGQFSGQVAFAGYGITAAEYSYDDYSGFDPTGKVVIVLRKEPQQDLANSRFEGTQNSQYAYFSTKELNAAKHKAAALLLVDDAASAAAGRAKLEQNLLAAEKALAELKQLPRPQDASELQRLEIRQRVAEQQVTLLTEKKSQPGAENLMSLNDAGSAVSDEQVPTYQCSRELVNRLLVAGIGKTLEDLEAAIDRDLAPHSAVLEGVVASGQVAFEASQTPARNVIGVLPGKGSLAEEYVVVGAHYDHVGMGGVGSLAPGTIAVHNGADDNASGTVTMLEVARQFAESTTENRRTIIFMAFAAEESGLLGSRHYVRNPRWPLEKTVAMINLDMVGRLNNDELTVYGTGTASEFAGQIDRLNQQYQFKVVKVPQGRGASDHASFYDARVPVYHFFTGLHNDYHRPSDDVEKVNVDGIVRIGNLVFDVAREIADAPERPHLLDIKGSASPRNQNGSRATLGVQLDRDMAAQARVLGVSPGGAAETAGLQSDDVIVEVESKPIATVADLRKLLTNFKSGQSVTVAFSRNNQIQTVTVKLGE